jgi:hypothetical protein
MGKALAPPPTLKGGWGARAHPSPDQFTIYGVVAAALARTPPTRLGKNINGWRGEGVIALPGTVTGTRTGMETERGLNFKGLGKGKRVNIISS